MAKKLTENERLIKKAIAIYNRTAPYSRNDWIEDAEKAAVMEASTVEKCPETRLIDGKPAAKCVRLRKEKGGPVLLAFYVSRDGKMRGYWWS